MPPGWGCISAVEHSLSTGKGRDEIASESPNLCAWAWPERHRSHSSQKSLSLQPTRATGHTRPVAAICVPQPDRPWDTAASVLCREKILWLQCKPRPQPASHAHSRRTGVRPPGARLLEMSWVSSVRDSRQTHITPPP